MKKLIYLFLTVLIFACSSSDDNSNCPDQTVLNTFEVSEINYDSNSDLASAVFTAEINQIIILIYQFPQLQLKCELINS